MEETFLRATEIVTDLGGVLGPDCPPCSHNTLTLMPGSAATYPHALPVMF
jgi:hypothetical protein